MASYVGEVQNGKLKKYSGAPPAKLKVTTKATIIGTGVFAAKKSLTEVLLHDAVTEIGDSAFESCQNLKKVLLPNGLKRIGYAAFANCSQLCDLDLPDSLEEIGAYAFFNTSWLNHKAGNVYAGGF